MTKTVFEVQAVFLRAETREDAMAGLMACGYGRTSFGVGRHGPDMGNEGPGPETPAPPSGEDDGAAGGGVFVSTVRARDDAEQGRLMDKLRTAGAVRALAAIRRPF